MNDPCRPDIRTVEEETSQPASQPAKGVRVESEKATTVRLRMGDAKGEGCAIVCAPAGGGMGGRIPGMGVVGWAMDRHVSGCLMR